MWNYKRMRQTAGNVCLVLFIAFLFTITVTPYTMVGNAEAAQGTTTAGTVTTVQQSGGQYLQGGENRTVTGTDAGYNLLVELAGNPLSVFDTLRVDFVNGNGTIISVYGNDTTKVTYLSDSVYGKVYSLVYLAPSNFYLSANNVVYGKVYVGSTYLYSVILTLNPPPPSSGGSSSGGGGGGTTDPTTNTTTTTNTGTVTVSDGAATAVVDTTKVNNLINSNQAVVIEAVPAGTVATSIKVELVASILNTLAEKSKELTIKTDDVQFVIPAAALDVKALTDLVKVDANTKVTLNVNELKESLNLAGKENLQPVGKVFDFELIAKSTAGETKVSSFAKALKVAIPYTDSDLKGVKEEILGAYRINANGPEFLGGEVDKDKKLVWFETKSFSKYTLMAKVAAFADIVKHWAKDDIELLVNKGIVKGVSASNFAPESNITRAQFAALLVRALGLAEAVPANATFKDVTSGSWYYGAVEAAAAKGLVTGYKGSFNPEGKITRQEMAVMIARALKAGGKNVAVSSDEAAKLLGKFSDKQQIAGWAQEGVAVAVKENIVNGRTADTYVAKANATRAEGTVMIKRVLGSLGKL